MYLFFFSKYILSSFYKETYIVSIQWNIVGETVRRGIHSFFIVVVVDVVKKPLIYHDSTLIWSYEKNSNIKNNNGDNKNAGYILDHI